MKKGSNIIIVVLGVMLIMGSVFYNMVKFGGEYENPYRNKREVKLSSIIEKLNNIEVEKGKVILKSEDFNKILGIYFKGEKNIGNINIKGLEINTLGDKLSVNMPFRYKKSNLLLNTIGTISINKDKIIYNVCKVKLGKVAIPKSFLLNRIKEKNITGIEAFDNNISLDQSDFYLKVKKIEIKNNKIFISFK